MKNFIVTRLANKADGTFAAPTSGYEDEVPAWKEFYRLCGNAVDSTHIMDAVIIMTKEGFVLDHKAFPHPQDEPEETETQP